MTEINITQETAMAVTALMHLGKYCYDHRPYCEKCPLIGFCRMIWRNEIDVLGVSISDFLDSEVVHD